tara:strand:+ start:4199 stop:4426 length:228 start_codon:yes stop_codon:yes gene_type:complete
MSKVYHFRGNGDVNMKTYSKATYEKLKSVKDARLDRVKVGLTENVIRKMRKVVKGSNLMSNDELLIKFLEQELRI